MEILYNIINIIIINWYKKKKKTKKKKYITVQRFFFVSLSDLEQQLSGVSEGLLMFFFVHWLLFHSFSAELIGI